ncbi:MAG: isoleucine--tRNA ligase, partial [Bacteroidota bacterium]
MADTYPQHKQFSLSEIDKEILKRWEEENTFKESITVREGEPSFTFYEGPPSANGKPGIHHVMARTIKDFVCRYKTLKGFQVKRKGGWDTHGLPVEIQVEKRLGITKEDIGKTISVKEYNEECRKDVLKFKDMWDDLTRKMGYWVDLDDPYITFENNYIESVWNLLKRIHDKGLLYKGFTIQPYSPAAGTGLSSHELNQPGAYKDIKDTSAVAQFKRKGTEDEYFIAWTTTPWTLPSNTALAVGKKIDYVQVRTLNRYTMEPVSVILAKALMGKYFSEQKDELLPEDFKQGDKPIPYLKIEAEMKGADLLGIEYEQLLPYVQPEKPAFRVIAGDFVSTEDGTGIVHIAPTFGADDFKVAAENDIPPLLVKDENGNDMPLVDKQGRFVKEVTDFAGRYVKDYGQEEKRSADVDITIKLKQENKAFKVEKYEHSYPHCWRTDRPVLYYPLDSWFIRTTAVKDKLIELNKTINWKPASTGTGRFGNWLENLVDWNLSRSRFWGVPLPIWRTEDTKEEICIGSLEQLKEEMAKSVAAGFMTQAKMDEFFEEDKLDLHKPMVDEVVLVSASGQPMRRESDLIDVWFDSGAMPFAQWHYPFEKQDVFKANFPADFISEGVDQTRGWFFSLHAIAVMLEDSVAYKNVISTGLLLDKEGKKMSKRTGNVIDPFETIGAYGADATRWYMMGNTSPWENLRFDVEGVDKVRKKFFGTLYNTYSFFALYANIVSFSYNEEDKIAEEKREELDRWIISVLNSLIKEVEEHLDDYEPTRAVRAIEEFVDQLSNWYVRLSRRRFWDGDKAAFETLHECLRTVSILMSPFAPFYSDWLYRDLEGDEKLKSVHHARYPEWKQELIDLDTERGMSMAQRLRTLIARIRKKEKLNLRQPLQKTMVVMNSGQMREDMDRVRQLIASEVNVKEVEYITEDNELLVKKIKPNFRALGPKVGKLIKEIGPALAKFSQEDIRAFEQKGAAELELSEKTFVLELSDVEITSQDIPGWAVASDGKFTVALDLHVSEPLKNEGIAREFVSVIQRIRKEKDFDVMDKIDTYITTNDGWDDAIKSFSDYICNETLTKNLQLVPQLTEGDPIKINGFNGQILLTNLT